MKIQLLITLIITFFFNFASNASAADKVKEIVKGIATLPATKVILQHTADVPPAVGGTETVLVHKGMRYTVWNWTYKSDKGDQVEWLRVYYRKDGTRDKDTLEIVGDANLTGKVVDAFSATDKSLGSVFTGLEGSITDVHGSDSSTKISEEEKKKVIEGWQKRYDAVISALADYLQKHR